MYKTEKFLKGNMSPFTIKLSKITIVLVFFCFAECAAGSCLSYGHACWGAHGKRNGGGAGDGQNFDDTKLFLARLLESSLQQHQPISGRNIEVGPLNQRQRQLYNDIREIDPLKLIQDDLRTNQDVIGDNEDNESVFDDYPAMNKKLKSAKIFDNRSEKMVL